MGPTLVVRMGWDRWTGECSHGIDFHRAGMDSDRFGQAWDDDSRGGKFGERDVEILDHCLCSWKGRCDEFQVHYTVICCGHHEMWKID